jgi:hypothetical protein
VSDQPWDSDHWSVSPHNFDPNVIVEPHPVELHDITIRDGEECADLAYNVDDKVRIAEALATVGVRRTELFLTVPGWLEAVRAILARQLPLDVYVDWNPGRVERAIELGVRHIMVWYLIGEHQISRRVRAAGGRSDSGGRCRWMSRESFHAGMLADSAAAHPQCCGDGARYGGRCRDDGG